MPTKVHPDQRYTPVICNICKQEMNEVVTIQVRMPVGYNNFTKLGLRSDKVQILGFDPIPRQINCGCLPEPVMPKDWKKRPRRAVAGDAATIDEHEALLARNRLRHAIYLKRKKQKQERAHELEREDRP